uniref:Polycomb protein putative n=1 Tax=Albugo laibachii Nc14 TaxID=890382 RepID=F0WMB0_9STRA|nr:polycomb protein putative [Albugo laibachii Nc14]|eukprot:CCA22441.1 polycomb protein putative [Albugo laibachii Nc14]
MSSKRKRGAFASKRTLNEFETPSQDEQKAYNSLEEKVENEFIAAYHGVTALYKWLEVKHIQSPLFLPRTLQYRQRQAEKLKSAEIIYICDDSPLYPGATLRSWKLELSTYTLHLLRKEFKKVGLRLVMYSKNVKDEAIGNFEMLATCTFPVPLNCGISLPSKFVQKASRNGVIVLVIQLIELDTATDKKPNAMVFQRPSTTTFVQEDEINSFHTDRNRVLCAGPVALDPRHPRRSNIAVELKSVTLSTDKTDSLLVKCKFLILWEAIDKASKTKKLSNLLHKKENLWNANDTFTAIQSRKKAVEQTVNEPVWFHYLFDKNLRRRNEFRNDLVCPWCNMLTASLRGLLTHLTCSHDRLHFSFEIGHDLTPHIHVKRQEYQFQHPQKLQTKPDGDEKVHPFQNYYNYIAPERYKRFGSANQSTKCLLPQQMQMLEELEDYRKQEQSSEFHEQLKKRQYFHSRTGAVVLDHEKDYDSDEDIDESWIITQSEKLLDEFEDVSLEEKEFMKRWNRHLKKYRILADFMVASACRLFAKENASWLVENGLRYPFLLHLFNLWDNSLLHARAILECMIIMDDIAEKEKTGESPEASEHPIKESKNLDLGNGVIDTTQD